MRLYKYLPSSRLSILVDGLYRFTQPDEFNDPFELTPLIEHLIPPDQLPGYVARIITAANSDEKLRPMWESQVADFERERGITGVARALPYEAVADRLKSINPDLEALLKATEHQLLGANFYDGLRDRVAAEVGILSLSEVRDSLLMWAHYADQHQGLVVEFDTDNAFFRRELGQTGFPALQKVRYQQERPSGTLLDLNRSDAEVFENMARMSYLTKSEEWQYEHEWRMMLPTSEATRSLPGVRRPICLFAIPLEAVTGVILGARATAATSDGVAKAIASWPRRPEVWLATLSRARYALDIQPQ